MAYSQEWIDVMLRSELHAPGLEVCLCELALFQLRKETSRPFFSLT